MSSGNVPRYLGRHTGVKRLRSRLYTAPALYPDTMEIEQRGGDNMDIKKIIYWITLIGPIIDIVVKAFQAIRDLVQDGPINKFTK